MNTKKRNRKANRRILLYLIVLITIVISIFLTFPNYALKIINKYNEKKFLENNLIELKEKQKTLEKEVEQLNDNEYIAKIARQKYLFSKDGEIIIKVDKKQNNQKNSDKIEIKIEEKYKYIIEFVLFLAIILIIKKQNKKNKRKKLVK